MDRARVVLWVIDATAPATVADLATVLLPRCAGKTLLVVINKTDLAAADAVRERLATLTLPEGSVVVEMSARREADVERLRREVERVAVPRVALDADTVVVTNARHHEALTRALEALRRGRKALHDGVSAEFVAQDLREVMAHIGSITGTITTDAVLHDIFDNFCIGK